MKLLSDILSSSIKENIKEQEYTASSAETTMEINSEIEGSLGLLGDIVEMADDIYHTVGSLDQIDSETSALIRFVYTTLDDTYTKIDQKYGIEAAPENFEIDDADVNEAVELEEAFRPGAGMVPAPIGKDTVTGKGLVKLWGIQMRSGKWADTFVGMYNDTKPFGIITSDGITRYSTLDQFNKAFKSIVKSERLDEKLDSDASADEWIADFIKSDAPQFEGKTKKERIKMALGAYYAAQKNEDTLDEAYGESWVVYDKNTKAQIKSFKTRKGAKDYAAKSGGVVYSAEYYADNKDDIKSGKLVKEAQNFVSKGIYTLDGKKIDGARSSKLFLQALDGDGFLHNLSWKEWSASNLKDTSSDSAKKQFVDRLAKEIKMFNKRVNLNTWLKGGNRSFTDTVNYIFKLDPNIKYGKASGLKEDALQEAVSKSFIDDLIDAGTKEQRKNKQLRQGQAMMIALKSMNSKLYSDVTGTDYDPFYNDKKISALLKHLNPNWKFSNLGEAIDTTKWKQLAATGLMSNTEANQTLMALQAIENDKSLTPKQLKLLASTAATLIGVITGDSTILSKVKGNISSAE